MSAGKLQRNPSNGKCKRNPTNGKIRRNTGSITACCCGDVCCPTEYEVTISGVTLPSCCYANVEFGAATDVLKLNSGTINGTYTLTSPGGCLLWEYEETSSFTVDISQFDITSGEDPSAEPCGTIAVENERTPTSLKITYYVDGSFGYLNAHVRIGGVEAASLFCSLQDPGVCPNPFEFDANITSSQCAYNVGGADGCGNLNFGYGGTATITPV